MTWQCVSVWELRTYLSHLIFMCLSKGLMRRHYEDSGHRNPFRNGLVDLVNMWQILFTLLPSKSGGRTIPDNAIELISWCSATWKICDAWMQWKKNPFDYYWQHISCYSSICNPRKFLDFIINIPCPCSQQAFLWMLTHKLHLDFPHDQ